MMRIDRDDFFWSDDRREAGPNAVVQVFPDVHSDARGSFSEQWKFRADHDGTDLGHDAWILNENWIRQVNVSKSQPLTMRGCHAQSGCYCQAKLVTSLSGRIFDIITDLRPMSSTFGRTKVYFLNPDTQNKLFVPRGFLHAFITAPDKDKYIFQYMCDNVYNKESEVKVNPLGLALPSFKEYCQAYGLFLSKTPRVSEEDEHGTPISIFKDKVMKAFNTTGALWYDEYDVEGS